MLTLFAEATATPGTIEGTVGFFTAILSPFVLFPVVTLTFMLVKCFDYLFFDQPQALIPRWKFPLLLGLSTWLFLIGTTIYCAFSGKPWITLPALSFWLFILVVFSANCVFFPLTIWLKIRSLKEILASASWQSVRNFSESFRNPRQQEGGETIDDPNVVDVEIVDDKEP